MSPQTARFILHREGLDVFSPSELRQLLADRFNPLPERVMAAILALFQPRQYNRAYKY